MTKRIIGITSGDDARVGSTKDGACDMIYKLEHIVDLESGAIIAAAVRPGDAGGRVEEIHGGEHREGAFHVKDPTGDKGFHSPGELAIIQESAGLRIILREPQ